MSVALLVHLARPPGTTPGAGHRAWRTVLLPLIEALEGLPGVRLGLALGGDWVADLGDRQPDGIRRLHALAEAGRVELMATPGHGPVPSFVPEHDLVDQLKRSRTALRAAFGANPRGAWLPHGLWTPQLPAVIARAGLAWAPISDRALRAAGLAPGPVAWATERHGLPLRLLVVDEAGSALAAGGDPDALAVHLERRRAEGRRATVWRLGREATGVVRLAGRVGIHTVSPSSLVGGPLPRAYIPSWAPADFGGMPERHLLACDAADRLHKRMLRVSARVRRAAGAGARPEQALRYLYRAQHGAAYLEAPAGAALDPATRRRAWRDLLRAEQALGQVPARAEVRSMDVDADGDHEIVLATPELEMVVDPARGGGVTALVHRSAAVNLVDTATRQPRPFHAAIPASLFAGGDWEEPPTLVGELPASGMARATAALERAVGWDRRPRVTFAERFIDGRAAHDELRRGRLPDGGWWGPWDVVTAEPRGDAAVVQLARTGPVRAVDGAVHQVRVHKRITLAAGRRASATWELGNRSYEPLHTRLATVIDLTPGPIDELVVDLGDAGARPGAFAGRAEQIARLDLHGGAVPITLQIDPPAAIWHHPIATVERRDGRWDVHLQALSVVVWWPLALLEGDQARFAVELTLAG